MCKLLKRKIDVEAIPNIVINVFINVLVKDTLIPIEPSQSNKVFFFDDPNAQMVKAGINRSAG